MTRPFQLDNFVQSQIAMGNSYGNVSFPSNPHSRNNLQASHGNQTRNSLKQKINDLLGLCKDENDGIKSQFKQVMNAEKDILNLMKEELDQPAPRFNNYARSNVEMFPGPSQVAPPIQSQYNQVYEEEQRPRGYQSFPVQKTTPPLNFDVQPQPHQTSYPQYSQQQYQQYNNQQGYQQPQQHQVHPSTYQRGYYEQPYTPDYGSNAPHAPQGSFGFGSAPIPNDRANILKSKVMELKEQNNRLKNLTNQHQNYYDDDIQIQQLQNQVLRLRNIIQNYENQLSTMGNSPKVANQKQLLRRLLDQGERIRQDTISLLRNKSAPVPNYAGNQNVSPNYVGSYVSSGGYKNSNQYAAGGRRGTESLNSDQYALLKAQLNDLRMQCAQLHEENANIKRVSKGTNFTAGSRRY